MKNIKITLITFLMVIMISCSPSNPDSSQIKSDLVDQSFYTTYGNIRLNEKNIKKLDIISNDLDKDNRLYHVNSQVLVDQGFLDVSLDLNVEYTYIPNEGWHLNRVDLESRDIGINHNKSLEENEIKEDLRGRQLTFDVWKGNWVLDDISSFEIISQTYEEDIYNRFIVDIESSVGYEKYSATLELLYKYNFSEEKWQINKTNIVNLSKILVKDINVEDLKKGLEKEIIELSFDNEVESLTDSNAWKIDDLSEVQEINIISSSIESELYTNNLNCGLKLKKNNIIVEGNVDILANYEDGEWQIDTIQASDLFKYSIIVEANISKEDHLASLVDKNFKYKSSFWNNSWTIKSEEIISMELKESYYSEFGMRKNYLVWLKLKDEEKSIEGNAILIYDLNKDDKVWAFDSIIRQEDFSEIK